MNILAMDTCFGACSVAVGKTVHETGTAWHHEFELRQTGHAEVLMPMVERVMAKASVKFSELERIAVTTGPGSFTGMRIGIAAARAMGVTLGIPVVGLPTLQVVAHDTQLHGSAGPLIVAVDARKDQVYAQAFDGSRQPITAPAVLSIEAAACLLDVEHVTICGSGAALVTEARQQLGLPVTLKLNDLQPSALALGMGATAIRDAELRRYTAQPLYLRPPDAKPQDGKSLARAS